MSETTWSTAEVERARQIWAEYQKQHDVSDRLGQTVGIDPVSGRVWFGTSAKDIWQQQDAEGIDAPCYYVRVGKDYYLRRCTKEQGDGRLGSGQLFQRCSA